LINYLQLHVKENLSIAFALQMPWSRPHKLIKSAIPRYWRMMAELPKTETQRVIKGPLEKQGVTPDTIDTDTRAGGKKA